MHYRPGDLVLRRRKVAGKLATRAEGPYEVIKVGRSFLQRITIRPLEPKVGPKRAREGHIVEVHASQLIPFLEGEKQVGALEDVEETAAGLLEGE